MLTAKGKAAAAKRFFLKTLNQLHTGSSRVITVDKNPAEEIIKDLIADKQLPETTQLRQKKYQGNVVEQDYRGIKRLVKPGMGFKSFNTARRTIKGAEIIGCDAYWSNQKCRERSRY